MTTGQLTPPPQRIRGAATTERDTVPGGEPARRWELTARRRYAAGQHTGGLETWPGLSPLLLGIAALAAAVVQPSWPVEVVRTALWVGGGWRGVLVPAALLLAVSGALANTMAPGSVRRYVWQVWPKLLRWAATGTAAGLWALALGGVTGLLTAGAVLRALVFLLMQLALFPGTPPAVLLLVIAGAVLVADARAERLVDWLRAVWQRRPRGPERALTAAWPAAMAWLLGTVLAATLFPSAMQGWGHAEGPDAQRFNFYTSFFNFAFNDERVVQRNGFDLGGCGLALPPGQSGAITFGLERTPESLVLLKANFYNIATPCQAEPGAAPPQPPPAFHNTLEVSTDQGRTFQTVFSDLTVGEVAGDTVQDLTPLLGASRTYQLRFSAANSTTQRVTVLPSFVASVVVDPEAVPDPLFPMVPYLGTAACLAALACWIGGASRRTGFGVAVVVALAGGCAAALLGRAWPAAPSTAPDVHVSAILLGGRAVTALSGAVFLGVYLARHWRARGARMPRPRMAWLALACLVVTLVAADARWSVLMRLRYEFLLPDAQGYQAIAVEFPRKMAHYRSERYSEQLDQLYQAGFDGRASALAVFYAGGNNGREPLWPATLRLAYNLLGVSAFHTRLAALAFSVAMATLTTWLGWRWLHPVVGVTAGLLVATSPPLMENGVAGLREELVGTLFLCALGALFAGTRRGRAPSWWRVVLASLAAGGVVLVRADMVVLAGEVITLAAVVLRWPWRRWIAAGLLVGLVAGPMYLGYAFTHHDAFYPGTYGATVNRNLEFPDRMGTAGFPTAEEYAANWAAGPTISAGTYFFGYHTPGQFVAYTVSGFQRIFAQILFSGWQRPLLWAFVAGMGLLIVTRRWLVPALTVVALVPFYAFLAGVPNPWVFAPRYAFHAYPFASLAVAYAVWWLPMWAGRAWAARRDVR